jgi:hypothetical protein
MKIKDSKYKGVSQVRIRGCYIYWRTAGWANGRSFFGLYDTEREAAIAYDVKMIETGMEPVNILKPKKL